jgi:hypothetical protein
MLVSELIGTLVDPDPEKYGWTLATNMFVGNEPEQPDKCLTLYDTGGSEQDAKLADDMVGVQARLRFPNYGAGYTKLQNIRLALEGIAPYSNGDDQVRGIWIQTPVAYIGKSGSNHSLFTLNLRMLLTPADAGNRKKY